MQDASIYMRRCSQAFGLMRFRDFCGMRLILFALYVYGCAASFWDGIRRRWQFGIPRMYTVYTRGHTMLPIEIGVVYVYMYTIL